jgi:tetratricopeptide (TPR) repeat protein
MATLATSEARFFGRPQNDRRASVNSATYTSRLLNHMGRLPAWLVVGILLSATFLSGCATFRKHADAADTAGQCRQLSREGVAAMERGDSAEAQILLDRAVKASPADVDARRQLAEVLWRGGNADPALLHIEEAVRLDPTHAATTVRCGEMLLGVGVADRALERANEALVLDPTLASAWALRGVVYRYRGEHQRALADLHQALRYNPTATDVLLDVAELEYQLGRPQRSLTTLQNMLENYPPGEEPRRALWLEGLAYSAVNRPLDAVDALAAASRRGAPEPELLFQLARAQNAAGQSAAAALTARQAADAGHEGSRTLLAQLQAAGAADGGTILR